MLAILDGLCFRARYSKPDNPMSRSFGNREERCKTAVWMGMVNCVRLRRRGNGTSSSGSLRSSVIMRHSMFFARRTQKLVDVLDGNF